ncbi:MAG: hypothetical protein WBB69_12025 [Anaerolineales bacterium]
MRVPRAKKDTLIVDMQPVNNRIEVESGEIVLYASRSTGAAVVSICGYFE